MGWAFIQKTTGVYTNNYFASKSTGPFTAATAIGNVILLSAWGDVVSGSPAAGNFIVTDDVGNLYTNLLFAPGMDTPPERQSWSGIWGAQVLAGGTPTVTMSANPTSFLAVGAAEFSGGSVLLDGPVVTGSTGLSASPFSLTIPTSLAGDLLVACANRYSGSNETSDAHSSPSGFTLLFQQLNDSSLEAGETEYEILSGISSGTVLTWSDSSRSIYWSGGVAALQLALPLRQDPGGSTGSAGPIDPNPNRCYRWTVGSPGGGLQGGMAHTSRPYR